MVIGFIFAWLPGIIFTAFKFKYANELKDLQWGDGKWEFWIRQTHNILGFAYGFSLYRNMFLLVQTSVELLESGAFSENFTRMRI